MVALETDLHDSSAATETDHLNPKDVQVALSDGDVKTKQADTPEDSDSELEGLPTPPDGGWGWMVVFSSFMIHIIADGVAYSFGVFAMEFLDYFKAGRGEVGWVGSLVVGMTLSSGPIASALTNKYDCRTVTIAGSVVAGLGFILSIFAPNMLFLYFSYGIVAGLGLGLIYLPAIVSVSYYFEKKRSFATGLAVCGSGIGTFIFAPMCKVLIDEFSWKGASLILAGLLFNCCVCGALFRPLEVEKPAKKKRPDVCLKEIEENEYTSLPVPKKKGSRRTRAETICITGVTITTDEAKNGGENGLSLSYSDLHGDNMLRVPEVDNLRKHNSETVINNGQISTVVKRKMERQSSIGPMNRKDIFYSASLLNIPAYRSNPDMYSRSVQSLSRLGVDEVDGNRCGKFICCSPEMRSAFTQMTDFSLLKDPVFLMFAISNLFTSIGFNVPYIFLPDRAMQAGIDSNRAAFLISVIGISNTVGRVIFGFMADLPGISKYRLYVYNTALTLCGICTALSPLANTYELMIVYAASFGLFIGTYVTLTSVILVDLLGLDRLTSSFGLLLIFQGVATILGPPIAGWVYDATGSYDASFYITGFMIGLSGFMLYFIPLVRKLSDRCMPARQPSGMEITQYVAPPSV